MKTYMCRLGHRQKGEVLSLLQQVTSFGIQSFIFIKHFGGISSFEDQRNNPALHCKKESNFSLLSGCTMKQEM